MNHLQYLSPPLTNFIDWFAQRLRGQPINFAAPGGFSYPDLRSALNAYSWPLRAQSGLPNPHLGLPHVHPVLPALTAHSSLAANAVVLNIIQQDLRAAYLTGPAKAHHLSGAVAAVFHWGGVYTGRGNRGWLAANHGNLAAILKAVVYDHARGDDVSRVPNLRFNSGMTKVYSLLIEDFIIYDSRVAAALAWFVAGGVNPQKSGGGIWRRAW